MFIGFPFLATVSITGTASWLLPVIPWWAGVLWGIPLGVANIFLGAWVLFNYSSPI